MAYTSGVAMYTGGDTFIYDDEFRYEVESVVNNWYEKPKEFLPEAIFYGYLKAEKAFATILSLDLHLRAADGKTQWFEDSTLEFVEKKVVKNDKVFGNIAQYYTLRDLSPDWRYVVQFWTDPEFHAWFIHDDQLNLRQYLSGTIGDIDDDEDNGDIEPGVLIPRLKVRVKGFLSLYLRLYDPEDEDESVSFVVEMNISDTFSSTNVDVFSEQRTISGQYYHMVSIEYTSSWFPFDAGFGRDMEITFPITKLSGDGVLDATDTTMQEKSIINLQFEFAYQE